METKPQPQFRPNPTLLHSLIKLDTAVSLHLYTFFQPILPFYLLKSLELSGDGRLFFPITISILFLTTPIAALTTTPTPATLLLINLLIGLHLDILLVCLIKHLIQRPALFTTSICSGHFPLTTGLSPVATPPESRSLPCFVSSMLIKLLKFCSLTFLNFDAASWIVEHFVAVVGMWAAITSVSRVLLGRHFVLDVVAGACLGVLEGVLVFRVFNYENMRSWFR
ncbi:hypothetical protein DH2020_047264 [Rehmannia glutinosa]|uniref:Phosphatidic acid phosphatase type 2/haloperoxidase domain-containing protein n=1 Tax=Rehmannia glutinosa TaxID=99300 RepID=A0ABR0U905_REHGL